MCVCVCVLWCIEERAGAEEEKKQETAPSTIGQIWEGRLSQTARMLTHLWASVSNQSRLFLFLLQMIFSHTYAHTHSPVHYFSVGWLNGQRDKRQTEGQRTDRGLRITTEANVTFFLVCFIFSFLVIDEQCCFLGLMGGRTTWFGSWNKK